MRASTANGILRSIRALFAASILAVVTAAVPARADDVLVFAAASTTDAIDAAIKAYRAPAGSRIRASFASSSTLARQIANGAPANIYLSANEQWMNWLAKRNGIVPGSRRDLLRNSLVLIAPKSSDVSLKIAPGFGLAAALDGGRLALGDPSHVPAGIYAKQALTKLGVWDSVAGHLAPAENVRAALALVARGEAPLGIVYATDARIADVRVIDSFPRNSHPPIVYPAALVHGADTPRARKFYDFLRSPEAGRIFARFGFGTD